MKFKALFLLTCVFFLIVIESWAQFPSLNFSTSGNASGCAPKTVTFNIGNTATNVSNTTYILDFGDESPVLNYTQANIPSTVSHTYTTISCGETFGGQPNCINSIENGSINGLI